MCQAAVVHDMHRVSHGRSLTDPSRSAGSPSFVEGGEQGARPSQRRRHRLKKDELTRIRTKAPRRGTTKADRPLKTDVRKSGVRRADAVVQAGLTCARPNLAIPPISPRVA
ncbi:hypothetical protein GCM10020229_34990 [Kitasatospora albolonga]